jgi:hypothetical protein
MAISQVRAVVGFVAVTAACGGATTGESANQQTFDAQDEQVAPSGASGSLADEQADADSDSGGDGPSGLDACPVLETVGDLGCPQDWEAASPNRDPTCHLEPSADCGYFRVLTHGMDTSTLCLYDARNLKLVGGRFWSANTATSECWAVQAGFADPVGCQNVANTCFFHDASAD